MNYGKLVSIIILIAIFGQAAAVKATCEVSVRVEVESHKNLKDQGLGQSDEGGLIRHSLLRMSRNRVQGAGMHALGG
jgi:hypothetical protein